MPNVLDDLYVTGAARFGGPVGLPASTLANESWNPSSPLAATNQQHQYAEVHGQAHGSSASAERRVLFIAHAAGTLVAFKVTQVVAATGDSTATVNLLKNGTTVLSASVVINNSRAAFAVQTATIAAAAYAAGDVFEIQITVSAGSGTLPQGVSALAVLREAAA
jgi:hypothetical protein